MLLPLGCGAGGGEGATGEGSGAGAGGCGARAGAAGVAGDAPCGGWLADGLGGGGGKGNFPTTVAAKFCGASSGRPASPIPSTAPHFEQKA